MVTVIVVLVVRVNSSRSARNGDQWSQLLLQIASCHWKVHKTLETIMKFVCIIYRMLYNCTIYEFINYGKNLSSYGSENI